jgi:hypothetical protein
MFNQKNNLQKRYSHYSPFKQIKILKKFKKNIQQQSYPYLYWVDTTNTNNNPRRLNRLRIRVTHISSPNITIERTYSFIHTLELHKNDNFLGEVLNFVLFHCYFCLNIKVSYKNIFDRATIGGDTIIPLSLRLKKG